MKEMIFSLAIKFVPVIFNSKLVRYLLCSKQAKIIIEAIRMCKSNETLLSLMRNSDGSWRELLFPQSRRKIERLDFKTIIDDLNQVEKLGYIRYDGDKGIDLRYTILK